MNPPDSHSHSLPNPREEAMAALLSGEAGPKDLETIRNALREDPEFRKTYCRVMETEAMIDQEFPAVELPGWTPTNRARHQMSSRAGWWVISAAAVALMALLLLLTQRDTPNDAQANRTIPASPLLLTLAKVTELIDADVTFEGRKLIEGERLPNGGVTLKEGSVEITFDSGAVVELTGPASFRVESEFRGSLIEGSMTADVPKQAKGFLILTPSALLRDLGTSFAVTVRSSKVTDLHVWKGLVEASPRGEIGIERKRLVRKHEAVRLSDGTVKPIAFEKERFLSAKALAHRAAPVVHWTFESWDRNRTMSESGEYLLKMRRVRQGAVSAKLVPGPVGQALRLDENDIFGISNYPGIGGSSPRTVAFWIRLAADASSEGEAPNGIVAWGGRRASSKWQISWNRNPVDGAVGAPRVEFGEGFVIGSTDLRDGKWHHVAVVYIGGDEGDVTTLVRIYVDSRLEQLSGRQQQTVSTDTRSESAAPLSLGSYLGPRPRSFQFEGDLDEVQVFDEAILPSQIAELSASGVR